MAKTILELINTRSIANGIYIKVQETINRKATNTIYRIHGHNMHATDVDSVMLIRHRAHEAIQMNSENISRYEDSELDNYLNTTYLEQLPQDLRRVLLSSPIIIRDKDSINSYTIVRKVYLPSYTEWNYGAINGVPEGQESPYIDSSDRRKMYNDDGLLVTGWLRSWSSATSYFYVQKNGNAGTSYATDVNYFIPAFDIPTSLLVADTPDPDGSYRLLYTEQTELPGIDYTVKIDESDKMYLAVKLDCEIIGAKNIECWACNNFLDNEPVWEEIEIGQSYDFWNYEKTADKWGLGIRIKAVGEQTVIAYEPYISFLKG